MRSRVVFCLIGAIIIMGCTPSQTEQSSSPAASSSSVADAQPVIASSTPQPLAAVSSTPTPVSTLAPPNSPTPRPTLTSTPSLTPSPSNTPTLTPTPSVTPTPSFTPWPTIDPDELQRCDERFIADDDYLAIVTKTFGLSPAYEPENLVSIEEYFDREITRGYPTLVRRELIEPLGQMLDDMLSLGLEPYIISGYRSFYTQSLAYNKWVQREPERADQLSAPPGFSEHQLGTVIDFGSPNLSDYIEDDTLEFHTYFYKTPEGAWLIDNAHRYGFTLSYTREATDVTGFYYEPWHYRYIGSELATYLYENSLTLVELQLSNQPTPCLVDNTQ